MTEPIQENTTTPAQENAEAAGEPKKRIRRTKEQRLAELQRKAAKLETEIKQARDKKLDHQKIVLGGWLIAAMRKNPDAMQRILNEICDATDLSAPRVDFSTFLRRDHPGAA